MEVRLMLVNNSNTLSLDLQASKHISLGIDQGDSQWVMTAFDRSSGKKSRHCFKGATKELDCYRKVSDLSKTGKPVSVCYEAGRSGFTPARVFSSLGCECRVLPYGKLQIISSGKKAKTDNIDSVFLSELNPLDKSIPSVWLPEVKQECLRVIPREEQRLKRDISRNNNRIISILQRWPVQKVVTHLRAAEWRVRIREWKNCAAVPGLLPVSELKRIEMMTDELELLEKHLLEWGCYMDEQEKKERSIAEQTGEKFTIDILREYRGIGEVIARTFSWEIGDFNRFRNGKHFSSYLGLTPTPFASGKMFREQGISKQGNPELRRLAIQLAWLWKHWQPDSKIARKWKEQLKNKGRQRKTAIVAMARQLMVAIYRRIVRGEEIEGAVKNRPMQ